jgi:hypothetical protein
MRQSDANYLDANRESATTKRVHVVPHRTRGDIAVASALAKRQTLRC